LPLLGLRHFAFFPIFPLDQFFSLFYPLTFKKLFFALMLAPLIARSGPNPAGGLAVLVILKTLGKVFAVWAGRIRGSVEKSHAVRPRGQPLLFKKNAKR
jgi:hypothetical protein